NVMMGSAATAMSELFNKKINISPPDAFRQDLGEKIDSLGNRDELVAVVSFRFSITAVVDSVMLQIIDIDFAKEMVEMLFSSGESEPVEKSETQYTAVEEQEPAPAAWGSLQADGNQDHIELGNLNIELIKDIPVKVRAILGRTKMSIENILKLGPGHIMELD